jgi:hypothetical protein
MTTEYSKEALADWQRANAEARAAEAVLEQAMILHAHWSGPAIPDTMLLDVMAFRSRADAKMRAAFRALQPVPGASASSANDALAIGVRAAT